MLDEVPAVGAEILGATCASRWRLLAAPRLDIAPEPLVDLVRRAGANSRDVFAFLTKHLLAGHNRDSAGAVAHRAFARAFITAAAERDGFIELVAAPDTGGLFAQGWSMSLPAGVTILADAAEDLVLREVEVAHFEREDVLPPARGFCLFGKAWAEDGLATVNAVFFEEGGRLLRLDVVPNSLLLRGERATAHAAQMQPRLAAPQETLGAFKRVCRPRFAGEDTLSSTSAPIAAALDAVLQAPDGTLLAFGWLLDPLRRVERVLIKSTANLYAHLDRGWCALPRPDLGTGFAQDARFTNLLDACDEMHGFIAHAGASRDQVEGAEVYLELVLEDGSCLFRPATVTPFASADLLPQLLRRIAPNEPELSRIVEEHLAPFLKSVRPGSRAPARTARRAILLGTGGSARQVAAIIPFCSYPQLQPILALLAGTPEAEMLDLVLVTSRRVASETLEKLSAAFGFFGLRGSLTIASEQDSVATQLDLGAAATTAEVLLCWMPAVLPKAPGWLGRMLDEAAALPARGLLSPALTYEDGSIYFGGAPGGGHRSSCGLSGYNAGWLHRGAPRPALVGAAEIALLDRDALAAVDGFAGHLFGDAYVHVDLAERLAGKGFATWCSGAVEFWILDDAANESHGSHSGIVRKIDAALLDRRKAGCAAP